MKTKQVTFLITAALEQQKDGRVLIDGYYIIQQSKTWLGRDKFLPIGKYKNDTDAVHALNKLLNKK